MFIKTLSQSTINRIAAGEVIERPASALKELVENSIDAKATIIDIIIHNSGQNLISITDNGIGMTKEDLELAVLRHTTSKLNEDDLLDIKYFGFRGEALPSIASVSRLSITSKFKDSEDAWCINISGGNIDSVIPAAANFGTKIEVKDLFFATPARLKFLKTEKTELQYAIDAIKKIALAYPYISFSLKTENRDILSLIASKDTNLQEAKLNRINEIIGKDFASNSVIIDYEKEDIKVSGYTSIPTYNKSTSSDLYLFVNNRPVRDKLLITAIRIAYQDYISRDKYPIAVLFLDIPFIEVDVNVHPAKMEVRFRDEAKIRNFIIGALKNSLIKAAHQTSTGFAAKAINYMHPKIMDSVPNKYNYGSLNNAVKSIDYSENKSFIKPVIEPKNYQTAFEIQARDFKQVKVNTEETIYENKAIHPPIIEPINEYTSTSDHRLGIAKAQISATYIIAETADSIIIVDQHAAHERLVYEKLKLSVANNNIIKQRLLIPEVIELDEKYITKLIEHQENLNKLGLMITKCSHNAVIIHEVPSLIKQTNVNLLIKEIAEQLVEYDENLALAELTEHILKTFACHHSIRAGRRLSIDEMNHLLREMEQTPFSGQCNHGRPTYVELKVNDMNKLFGRS